MSDGVVSSNDAPKSARFFQVLFPQNRIHSRGIFSPLRNEITHTTIGVVSREAANHAYCCVSKKHMIHKTINKL